MCPLGVFGQTLREGARSETPLYVRCTRRRSARFACTAATFPAKVIEVCFRVSEGKAGICVNTCPASGCFSFIRRGEGWARAGPGLGQDRSSRQGGEGYDKDTSRLPKQRRGRKLRQGGGIGHARADEPVQRGIYLSRKQTGIPRPWHHEPPYTLLLRDCEVARNPFLPSHILRRSNHTPLLALPLTSSVSVTRYL